MKNGYVHFILKICSATSLNKSTLSSLLTIIAIGIWNIFYGVKSILQPYVLLLNVSMKGSGPEVHPHGFPYSWATAQITTHI